MDASHLNQAPPYWLEWLVERVTPEQDRDAIVGDLREIYLCNRQYLAEALRTVPSVIVGRACAQLDVPSLFLQLFAIFLFAGQWGACCALPLLWLTEAYRAPQQPAIRRVVFEATFVSAAAFVILEISSFQALTAWRVGVDPDKTLALYLLLICPLIPPAVCGLSVSFVRFAASSRLTGEVPAGDGHAPRRQNRDSKERDQHALARRLRNRRQLFWFCCAAPMIALHVQFVERGLIEYRPFLVEVGYVSAGIVFFLGLAFSRSCTASEAGLPNFAQH